MAKRATSQQTELDLDKLVMINAGRPVLCYTHTRDVDRIRAATKDGFHINISADFIEEAEIFVGQGLSTVVVLSSEYGRYRSGATWTETLLQYRQRISTLPERTPNGIRIAVCPEAFTNVSCDKCRACTGPRKKGAIVGFPAHGSRKAQIDRRTVCVRGPGILPRSPLPGLTSGQGESCVPTKYGQEPDFLGRVLINRHSWAIAH